LRSSPRLVGVLTALSLAALTGCHALHSESPQHLYSVAYSGFRGEHYAEALQQSRQGEQLTGEASELHWRFRLLTAAILLGQREAASAEKALAFELPQVARTPANQSRFFLLKGFSAGLLRDYDTARTYLDHAASLAQDSRDGELLAEVENRQGLVAASQGRFEDAGLLFHRALEYASAHKVPWLQIAATGNLGYQLMGVHKYDEAVPWFQEAVRLARQFRAVESEGRNVGNLGWCYYRIGDLDKARASLETAVAVFEKTPNRLEQQNWLGNLASVYVSQDEFDAAKKLYLRALDLARQLGDKGFAAIWLNNLAKLALQTGDLDAAQTFNDQALALKQELHLVESLAYSELNAARIASGRKQHDEARRISQGIVAKGFSDPTLRVRAHDELAGALAALGDSAAADREYRICLAEIEKQRREMLRDDDKRAYLSSLIGFYEDYVQFLMDQGKIGEALQTADASHARSMRERLRMADADRGELRRVSDFQRLAKTSATTLLCYSLGRQKSYLWVVSADQIQSFPLPPQSQLISLLADYDKSIQNLRDPLAQSSAAGQKLYETLIAPALPALKKTGRALIVPDGPLYSLNFETLPVAAAETGAHPHYWIEDATIAVTPALGLLGNPEQLLSSTPGSLLMLGDPVSPDPEFPKLMFAAKEMDSIEGLMPHARKTVLRGSDAKPAVWAQLEPAQFSLIHFAAHAAANREEPLESSVILSRDAGAASASYKLRAMDLVKTPIHARLVTLSACKSAGIRIYAGEGLVGLASAFLEAGARNVIAGLWDVNDESGARMMTSLYAGLAAGKNPPDALHDAKLALIHAGGIYRKPWYWGAFQLFTTDAR